MSWATLDIGTCGTVAYTHSELVLARWCTPQQYRIARPDWSTLHPCVRSIVYVVAYGYGNIILLLLEAGASLSLVDEEG